MKSILLSIRPKWLEKILNGEKTIEVRKSFPADYVGWVECYCTKDKYNSLDVDEEGWSIKRKKTHKGPFVFVDDIEIFNGKVVCRFWCDKVEEIKFNGYFAPNDNEYTTPTKNGMELMKSSCININELVAYFDGKHKDTIVGKAIHISKLEIFDRPKSLGEFVPVKNKPFTKNYDLNGNVVAYDIGLNKAPQNYCYVESEN